MKRPEQTRGMHHVALNVPDIGSCEHFYVDLLGMEVEWRPDKNNLYLCSGNDNLALHSLPEGKQPEGIQRLDHIGFILKTPEQVDKWYEFLIENDVKMKTEPRTHRDGARSFYCYDPAGNVVQMIYHIPLKDL